MTRIVQAANFVSAHSGGIRTTLEALGRGYQAAGHERVLVVPGERDTDETTPAGRRVTLRAPCLAGSGGAYRVITDRRRLLRLMESLAPERLEVSDKLTLSCLGPWARSRGVPAVAVSHERLDALLAATLPRGLPTRRLAGWWNRRLAGRFDTVVCTTAWAMAEFTQASGVAAGGDRVLRVPLGVDLEAFGPWRRSDRVRALLSPDGAPLLVYAGRLAPEKRPELAVRALAELLAQGVHARLVVVGQGPAGRRLAAEAAGLPVAFLGFVADREVLATLLASADVAVAPGGVETFGLAALEALASGTPVVAADTGALPELLGGDRPDRRPASHPAGLTAPADPRRLARAVAQVLAWDPHARRVAARGCAEAFPWSATVRGMLAAHGLRPHAAAAARSAPC